MGTAHKQQNSKKHKALMGSAHLARNAFYLIAGLIIEVNSVKK
jgi:hypothetical protein